MLKQLRLSFISFADTVRENHGKVLVHCQAGVSRSATICLAYLMYTAKVGLETAFEHIKSRRSVISPNLNFMRQLENYEKEIKSHDGTLNTSVSDSSMDSSMDTSSNETASSSSSGLQSNSSSSLSQGQVFGGGAFDFTFSPTFSSPNTPLLSPSQLLPISFPLPPLPFQIPPLVQLSYNQSVFWLQKQFDVFFRTNTCAKCHNILCLFSHATFNSATCCRCFLFLFFVFSFKRPKLYHWMVLFLISKDKHISKRSTVQLV